MGVHLRWLAAIGLSASVCLAPLPDAFAVTLELGLAIDGSGSISSSDFALQKDAYANVLADPTVLPQDGSVAIGVWLFSSSVTQVFPVTTIDAATIGNLIAAINAMVQPAGLTNIDQAIDDAAAGLLGFASDATRQIIDVSTDGQGNIGDEDAAADAAVAAGITAVNCLGIGAFADCGFIAGAGAFARTVDSFADFEDALADKIAQEVQQPPSVPEPSTLLLLLTGLTGSALAWRRQHRR